MGQLAVGLAGGAVGFAFGVPALGFTAGTFLGGLLFPPDPVRIEGPRRSDLKVSSSTHGRPIPEGFGVMRLPANLIWSSGLREVATTTEAGGKGGLGGPSQEQVNYTYFADCAFAFAQGPAEAVLRIWADGKKIYDNRDPDTTGATLTAVVKPGLTARIYLGSEDQLPCPTIVAAEGAANTPAYRGTVYVTLANFELTDFGNRIPQITAEIAFKATGSDGGRLSIDAGIADLNDTLGIGVDWKRDRVYSLDGANDAVDGLRSWSIATLQEIHSKPSTELGLMVNGPDLSASTEWHIGRHTGRIYIGLSRIDIIDPDSLTSVGYVGETVGGDFSHGVVGDDPGQPDIADLAWYAETTCLSPPTVAGEQSEKIFLIGHSLITDGPYVLDVTDPAATKGVVWDNGPPITQSVGGTPEPPGLATAVLWVLHHGGGNNTATLRKFEIDYSARMVNVGPNEFDFTGVVWSTATTFDAALWGNDANTGSTFVSPPIYDESDGNLIFIIARSTGTQVWKWDKANNAILWNTHVSAVHVINEAATNYFRIRNGRLGLTMGSNADDYAVLDTISGEVLESESNMNSHIAFNWWNQDQWFWDDTYQVFTGLAQGNPSMEQYFVGRKTGQGEALSDVVALLSGEHVNGAGLAGSQYDVTQLLGDSVRGYAVSRQMPVSRALEPLFTAYDFDATEVDDKVKYIKRGGASVAAITQADIVAADQLVRETRTQEVELPERIDLGYIDPAIDYQDNLATAKRVRAPLPTMYSLNRQTLDLSIVFSAAEAKQIAERLLFSAWAQRQHLAFALSEQFIRLVPTDVVTLTLDSGSAFELRITKVDIGVNHTQRYEAVVQEQALQAASSPTADPSLSFEEPQLPTSELARLCLIDAPYLRDIDATWRGSIELKYAMAGYKPGWKAGALWDSDDGLNFTQTGRTTAPKTYGIVTNALPAGYQNTTDTTTQLNVVMVEGELESVSDTDFLANGQVAIVGNPVTQNWEYVAYREAVQAASGAWTVSTLLRGRRGTDAPAITESHTAGELFIVADRSYIERLLLPLADHNVTRFYRGVGRDSFLAEAETRALASKARALMPFRPYQLSAALDGASNIDFAWNRANRLYFELTNATNWNTGPLDEDTEAYDLVIMDAPGGNDVRTLTVSSAAAAYTKAQQIADIAVGTGATTLDVGSAATFTRAGGSFVTDGFAAGQTIEASGFVNGANNAIFTVAGVAALTLTIEQAVLVIESGGGDEAIDALRGATTTARVHQVSGQVGRGFASAELTISL